MKKLTVLLLSAVACTVAAALAFAGNDPARPSAFGPSGHPVAATEVAPDQAEALARAGVMHGLRALRDRAGIRFYVADSSRGANRCFALGDAHAASVALVFAGCQSAENPFAKSALVDLSPRHGNDPADPAAEIVSVTRLVGFAADGVASVGVVGLSGSVIASTPVSNNTYASGVLADVPAKAIVALDSAGRTVGSIALTN